MKKNVNPKEFDMLIEKNENKCSRDYRLTLTARRSTLDVRIWRL